MLAANGKSVLVVDADLEAQVDFSGADVGVQTTIGEPYIELAMRRNKPALAELLLQVGSHGLIGIYRPAIQRRFLLLVTDMHYLMPFLQN